MGSFSIRQWLLEDGRPSAPLGTSEFVLLSAAWVTTILAATALGLWVLSKPVTAATPGELLATFAVACAACFALHRLVLRDLIDALGRRAHARRGSSPVDELFHDDDLDAEPRDLAGSNVLVRSTQEEPPMPASLTPASDDARTRVRGWSVRVSIPETTSLSREDRVMAEFTLCSMFRDGTLYVSTLKDLRSVLHPSAPGDERTEWWLHQLHCRAVRELPQDVQQIVLPMVSRYLCVDIVHDIEPPTTLPTR